MRRGTVVAVVAGLALAACGSGGDDAADQPASDEPTEEPSSEPAPADDDGSDDGNTTTDTGDDDSSGDDSSGDDSSGDDGGGDGGDGPAIDSLDEIPQQCRDLMEGFLTDIEPIVSPVDWSTASFSDFEGIADRFQEQADVFDTDSAAAGCDDLNFEDDEGFDLILDFADAVAPGTVPFFEFLDAMVSGAATVGGDEDDASSDGDSDAGADCDDVIASVEEMMAEYDAISEVPIAMMTEFANLSSVIMTCSPDQLAVLDSPEVNDFLSR